MIIIVNGFFVYYLLLLLLLENGGVGPRVPFLKRQVWHGEDSDVRFWDATVIDCLRRVLFMYECRVTSEENSDKIEKVWYVRDNQMTQMWSCPLCLGFWLAAGSVALNIFSSDVLNIFSSDILNIFPNLILNTIASAGVGGFLYDLTRPEGD